MTDLGWQAALLWLCLGSGVTLLVIGTHKRSKRRNRRVGLPAPACQRFPSEFDAVVPRSTPRQLPGILRRQAD